MNLITIKTYSNSNEASIDLGYLESKGIKCFLKNQNFLSAKPTSSIAAGGIQLQVGEEEAKKALELLEE